MDYAVALNDIHTIKLMKELFAVQRALAEIIDLLDRHRHSQKES